MLILTIMEYLAITLPNCFIDHSSDSDFCSCLVKSLLHFDFAVGTNLVYLKRQIRNPEKVSQ